MDKERLLVIFMGIAGFVVLAGTYIIGFYHGAQVEKEKLIQDILNYQRQLANYKRKIIEKDQKIKELETKTQKIVNLTQKVANVINNLPEEPKEVVLNKASQRNTQTNQKENPNVDQIFIMGDKNDEKKVKENFLLEPEDQETSVNVRNVKAISHHVKLKIVNKNKEKEENIFYTIQLGAFLKYDQAKRFSEKLVSKIKLPYSIFIRKEGKYYKVCLGKFTKKEKAFEVYKILKQQQIAGFIKKIKQ